MWARLPKTKRLFASILIALLALPVSRAQSPPVAIPASRSPKQQGDAILQHALLASVWGQPAFSTVRQSISVFDKKMTGVGQFVRKGEGSGVLRFSLRFSAQDRMSSLLQVCDGQRLLTIEDIGDDKRRSEVDLGRVRDPLVWTQQSSRDPLIALYLAIGGQAEVLRTVFQCYSWTGVRQHRVGDSPAWVLSGKLAKEPPRLRGQAEIDRLLFTADQSGMRPTKIELTIGTQNAAVPYWLYRMKMSQPSTAAGLTAMEVDTEWLEPNILNARELAKEHFQAPAFGGESFEDETALYLPPFQVAAKQSSASVNR